MRLGALEAGGTKMVCAVCTQDGQVSDRRVFPTGTPEDTIPPMIEYFKMNHIDALGIGCFGPIDPDPESPTYGYITSTPKPGWQNTDIVGAFREALNVPVGFDTDVNAAALGEATYGVTVGLGDSVYITVGTGIGAGIISGGRLVHGMMHPEVGHIAMRRHPKDTFEGWCPFHKDCLEGLAAGPAIEHRFGKKGAELSDIPEVWEMESYYIAQACVTLAMVVSPQRIVLGGGVMKQECMLPMVRESFRQQMAGYIKTDCVQDLEHYIVGSGLHDNQGILGAAGLALKALGL